MVTSKMTDAEAIERRVDKLLGSLTLEEKVSLLSGRDTWCTVPIERLGIPSLVMTDGPHGVRANRTGPERIQGRATSFPTGVSMASSWDPDLIERVGQALAEETRALGCDILLGPCVNIVRTPLAGRNFESYSEDPYLAGRIAVAWIRGLQSGGVGASLKHYACNNQEFERNRGSTEVDERTLREIYLPAFEAAVKEAQPWTVMCSYNRINGVYASENHYLLTSILREEWGFDGFVVSDWGAVHSTAGPLWSGLDLEMPGPAKWFGHLLLEAVRTWQVEEEVIDRAVRRILRIIVRSGKLDGGALPQGSVNTPEHQALAREVAEQSMVLLKNEAALLPLSADALRSVAVIGPNADEARIGGGGSSYLEPPYRVSPLEGLRNALGDGVEMGYERGCDNYGATLPAVKSEYLSPVQGEGPGLFAQYWNNTEFAGEPAAERVDDSLGLLPLHPPAGVSQEAYSVRWTGTLRVPTTGSHTLQVLASGPCRVYLDGEQVADATGEGRTVYGFPLLSATASVELTADRAHDLRVEFVKMPEGRFGGLSVHLVYTPEPDDRIERAAELARRSHVALVFAGMPTGFESEGHDRPDMALPGPQTELIRAVVRANPRTVVVLNCGAPVEMPWLDEVPAVLLAYYPGQEGGNAVANVLLGRVNPSGKLSVTYPRRYVDNPTYINYPGGREVHYGERIYVGYRYYDAKEVEPLFPFGHGLSYTTFGYGEIEAPDEVRLCAPLEVSVRVENTGARAGREVVQLYVRDVESSVDRPPKELKGFRKLALEPGESAVARFTLDHRSFAFYDAERREWVAEPGAYELLVGSSSRDIRARKTVTLV